MKFGYTTALIVASVAVGVVGFGCGSDSPKKASLASGCKLNSDCDSDLVCTFGLCHTECAATKDCPRGERCVSSKTSAVCQFAEEASCVRTSDCDAPLVCATDSQCRNACTTERDCFPGQVCATGGVCAEESEVDATGRLKNGGADAGAGGDASVADSGPTAAVAVKVGKAGGTVETADGYAKVSIPPNALTQDTVITIEPITPPVSGSVGKAWEMGPTGTKFSVPATLTLKYDDSDLAGKQAADFAVSTVAGSKWQAITGGGVNTGKGSLADSAASPPWPGPALRGLRKVRAMGGRGLRRGLRTPGHGGSAFTRGSPRPGGGRVSIP